MRNTRLRPRVFASSVVNGFETYRQAAREGIELAGGHPILINEDFPAQAASSRNVCLDAVASCDHFVIIVGERGGWRTPSGKLVVEEELDEARRNGIPVRAFLKRGDHDADAAKLAREISDYVSGTFRAEFLDEAELRTKIKAALGPVVTSKEVRSMSADFQSRLIAPFSYTQSPMLRLATATHRDEEVFDPTLLKSANFIRQIYEIGHSPSVALLDFQRAKESERTTNGLVIRQTDAWRRDEPLLIVRVDIEEGGAITIDGNITGRSRNEDDRDPFIGLTVLSPEIERFLGEAFAFVSAIYSAQDRFGRYEQLQYNVSLGHLGYGSIEESVPKGNSRVMNMHGNDAKPLIAHSTPRAYLRSDGRSISAECSRTAQRLFERSKAPRV